MIDALRFVKGAIKKSALTPEMEHYRIADGRVISYNGFMALSAPLDLDIRACPKAGTFAKALEACGDTVAVHMTAAGRLAIVSGKFKAYVPCLEDLSHDATPHGDVYEAPEGLLAALKGLYPFIGEDASRPWAMGAQFHGASVLATNNVVAVEYWHGMQGMPDCNVPRFAIAEIIRIGQKPISLQTDGRTLTFHYEGDRWLRVNLLDHSWPFDVVGKMYDRPHNRNPIEPELRDAIDKISAFTDSPATPLFFMNGSVSTSQTAEDGVWVEVPGLAHTGVYNLRQLDLVTSVATELDWDLYPDPVIFYGDKMRGLVMGRRA